MISLFSFNSRCRLSTLSRSKTLGRPIATSVGTPQNAVRAGHFQYPVQGVESQRERSLPKKRYK